MTVRVMNAGAIEFLTKPFCGQDVLDAIQQARPPGGRRPRGGIKAAVPFLTPRERQIMRFVVNGLHNKQIAAELGASEVTVKLQRGHVMQKMYAASVAVIALYTRPPRHNTVV